MGFGAMFNERDFPVIMVAANDSSVVQKTFPTSKLFVLAMMSIAALPKMV